MLAPSALSRRIVALLCPALLALAIGGCHRPDPRAALDRFFSTAQRQDYAATYDCYDKAYRAKVDREEFVRH
ncbi:MAG TPA: hypothetical protein VF805_14490, partial [Anaeromyxobacteraceae bacterium]